MEGRDKTSMGLQTAVGDDQYLATQDLLFFMTLYLRWIHTKGIQSPGLAMAGVL